MKLETNVRYQANIKLGLLERFASNEEIAERLEAVGFAKVAVVGVGSVRIAEGVWTGSTMECQLPSQVSSIKVIGSL